MSTQSSSLPKYRCRCGNVESVALYRNQPPGGKVCPECCRQFPHNHERVRQDEEGRR